MPALFIDMLVITKGVSNNIIVTLAEFSEGDGNYYLIRFVRRATGEYLNVVVNKTSDLSTDLNRYNKFTLNSALFNNAPEGQYIYDIYEQSSPTNTDPSLALRKVEEGWARIIDNTNNQYSSYAG